MRTPLLARWLLNLTVSEDPVGRSILGDLLEEYGERRLRHGAVRSWLWLHRQSLGVAARQTGAALEDFVSGNGRGVMGQDLRFALRSLRAHALVHGLVVAVVAVGIAGAALTFGMVNEGLLKSLPYDSPDQLYRFEHLNPEAGADAGRVSPMDADDLRDALGWRNQLTTWAMDPANGVMSLQLPEGPRAAVYAAVDESFFTVLGVPALLGRTLGPADNVPGQDALLVLSHAAWNRIFGGDPGVIDRTVPIGGVSYQVAGVMPPSFQFPAPEAEIFIPASRMTEDMVPNLREVRYREALLRVPSDQTPGQAEDAAESVLAGLAESFPASNQGWTQARLTPLKESLSGGYRTGVLFLMTVTGLLLLVVAAAVGGLLTARTSARGRELAVRLSLGADRRRLARQLVLESLLLSGAGGALGLALAFGLSGMATSFTSTTLGMAATIRPDITVAAFAVGISVLTGLMFGLIPAIAVLRAPPGAFLGGARGGIGGFRQGLRALVVVETAVAAILLAGTGLMLRSFQTLIETDPGFEAENVWSLRFNIPFSDVEQLVADRQRLVDLARDVPGVIAAGGSKTPLMAGGGEPYTFTADAPNGNQVEVRPEAGTFLVVPGFFETLGARFVSGRAFTDADPRTSIVVNRTLAGQLWPNEDPVGRTLRVGSTRMFVTGVIEPLQSQGLGSENVAAVYANAINFPRTSLYLFVRAEPGTPIQAVQEAIWAEYPEQAILETVRVTDLLDAEVARPRWLARVIAVFGGLSLLLAALGLYGVVAQAVERERGSIAVRIALGAAPSRVLGEQLRSGVGILFVGTAVGLVVALLAGKLVASLLFGVQPTDALSFLAAGLAVLTVGFIASLVPSLRATRIDPVHVIREE